MNKKTPDRKTVNSPEQFADVYGSPGETPRLAGLMRVTWPFFALTFFAGYLVRAAWPFPSLSKTVIGAAFLGGAGVLAWSVTIGRSRLHSFLKGAKGEEQVARALAFLPASYHVYHGIGLTHTLVGRAVDYDHVVVGPTGIFLIETKNWSGRITVRDGDILYNGVKPDRPPLEQVKQAATQLRRELRDAVHQQIEIQPVLCFASGQVRDGCSGAGGVIICTSHTLVDVLQENPDTPLPRGIREQVVYYLGKQFNEI